MRSRLWLTLASALAVTGCSNGNAAGDAGAGDATTADDTDGSEPAICTEFTEAGAPCPTASPVRCFACGDASAGCYCRSTSDGPRWTCITDPSCFPCTLGDEDCAPAAGDDASEASADGASD